MATRDRLIRQYVAERHGPDVSVSSYWTLWRTWGEWFGPHGAAAVRPVGRRRAADRPASQSRTARRRRA
jgi:hypothetical protein